MTNSPFTWLDRWMLVGLIGVAIAARCGVTFVRSDQLTIDRDAYLGIAQNLAAGKGFCVPNSTTPTAFRPPLYPLLLSAGMTLLPTAWAVAAINILAGGLTVWFVSRIGAALELGLVRHLAAMLIAIDPLLLNATAQPMTEVVFTAITTGWLWVVTRPVHEDCTAKWRRPVLTGLLFGLAALFRPTIWPLAGLMGLMWLSAVATRWGRRREWQPVLVTIVVSILVVSPWVVRNYVVFGRSIVMTTHGGYTLLLANNPVYFAEVVQQPWGTTWTKDSLSRWQANVDQKLHQELGSPVDELTADAWMSAEAKQYIRQQPGNFWRAALHRVRCLWSLLPRGEGASLPIVLRGGVGLFYGLEFVAVIVGGWQLIRRHQLSGWMPCLMLIVAIQGVHLVYWTDTRMRTPLQPVLALLAASALHGVSGRLVFRVDPSKTV